MATKPRMITITVEAISPVTITGAGYGNTYRYLITGDDRVPTLVSCERDASYHFELAGLPVPEWLAGPYDSNGRKI